MFLHILNDRQQRAFLALAKQFIEADRNLSQGEQNLLELMYAETNLPFETELPSGEPAELLKEFDSPQSRTAAVIELVGVGHADDEFHPEENAFLRKVAGALGVSDQRLAQIEDWVQRQLRLAQEAEQLLAS
jgi:tellurite resistance protein